MISDSASGSRYVTPRRWFMLALAAGLVAVAVWDTQQRNWRSAATSMSFVALLAALESGWGGQGVGRAKRAAFFALVLYVVAIAVWRGVGIVQHSAG